MIERRRQSPGNSASVRAVATLALSRCVSALSQRRVSILAVLLILTVTLAIRQLEFLREVAAVKESQLATQVHVMSQRLAALEHPYILVAGDSHAELLPWTTLCGMPVINIGRSGARVANYLRLVSGLAFSLKPRAVVLFIGTNDLAYSMRPATKSSRERFEADFARLITFFQSHADAVHFVPLMPRQDDMRAAAVYDLRASDSFRAAADGVCQRSGCKVVKLPAESIRFTEDGVHADTADRRVSGALFKAMNLAVCPTGAVIALESPMDQTQERNAP